LVSLSLHLPVSGETVEVRALTGADDLFLLEHAGRGPWLATAFLGRVATRSDGKALDFTALSLSDIDVALLELRRALLGDYVSTAVRCTASECAAWFDVSFQVSDYLRHHLPRGARVTEASEPGWFRFKDSEVSFRLPTVADVLALAEATDLERQLAARCIRPGATPALRRRVETAMQRLAPSLYSELDCACHECGQAMSVTFDPSSYVLAELARRARDVYDEVHLLARSYHWAERDILALPQERRQRYAELAHAERSRA